MKTNTHKSPFSDVISTAAGTLCDGVSDRVWEGDSETGDTQRQGECSQEPPGATSSWKSSWEGMGRMGSRGGRPPHIKRLQVTRRKAKRTGKQGASERWTSFFSSGKKRVQHSIETKMFSTCCNGLRQQPRMGSHNCSRLTHAHRWTSRGGTEPPRSLEVPQGTEVSVGCHGCKHAQLDERFVQVTRLWEEMTRLRRIQQSERDWCMVSCSDMGKRTALPWVSARGWSQASFQPWEERPQKHIRWGRLDSGLCSE